MINVYRFEIDLPSGPRGHFTAEVFTQNNELIKALCRMKRHINSGSLPEPEEDDPDRKFISGYHVSGCATARGLFGWLGYPNDIQNLMKLGFRLCCYEVERKDLGVCNKQVFFSYDKARLVYSLDTWDAFKSLLSTEKETLRELGVFYHIGCKKVIDSLCG